MHSLRVAYVLGLLFATGVQSSYTASPARFQLLIRMVNVTRRATLDEFTLTVPNANHACDNERASLTELRANCSANHLQAAAAGDGWCQLRCRCLPNTSSFLVHEKRCVHDGILRNGCSFVFGSWAWSTGWTWNSQSHPLEVVNLKHVHRLTIALNASTDQFSKCKLAWKAVYDIDGEWKRLNGLSDVSNVIFFKLLKMWHMSWMISEMPPSEKAKIAGRFMRCYVTCTHISIVDGGIEYTDTSSCVIFKVTGNLTHHYNTTGNNGTIRPTITTPSAGYNKRTTSHSSRLVLGAIIGGSLFIVALLAALLLYVTCCKQCSCVKRKITTEMRYSPDAKTEESV